MCPEIIIVCKLKHLRGSIVAEVTRQDQTIYPTVLSGYKSLVLKVLSVILDVKAFASL